MGEQREHKGRDVERYVREHPDVPLSIDEVAEAVGGWPTSSASSVMSRMVDDYPTSMERIRRGVYRWNSKPITPSAEEPKAFLLEVLTQQDAIFLCRDSRTGKLYKLSEFAL